MAVLFDFKPDWAGKFSVKSNFKTEIITSRLKREQRIAVRQLPRKTVEFSLKLSRGQMEDFQGFIARNQQGLFWLPDPTRQVELTASIGPADDTLPVTGTPGWLRVGQSIYAVGGGVAALFEVAAIGIGEVAIVGVSGENLPEGTRIYCVYQTTVDQKIMSSLMTNTAGQASMVFYVKPGTISEDEGSPATVFNGREVLTRKPDWSTAVSLGLEGYLETVDFDYGVTDEFAPVSFNRKTMRQQFTFFQPDQAEDFYQFYLRQKGQRGEFYMPTHEPDISPNLGAAIATSRIETVGSSIYSRYAGSSVYKALMVFFRDGTVQANKITAITLEGLNSRVTVLDPWTQAINESTVSRISFMPVWRMATDEVTFEWLTNTVSQSQVTMATLEDL